LDKWEYQGQAKVVLKINSKEEILDLEQKARNEGLNTYLVQDSGRTQV
jgi:PTH2 family peptidyl-tRNA hydrolase